jgi:hypothetical protein
MAYIFSELILKPYRAIITLLNNFYVLAFKHGQWKSIQSRMAIDAKGDPIPWYTYPSIEYLNSFDFSRCDVFEFGSGNSSLYWSSRASSVVSVEDDKNWFDIVKKNTASNHTLIYRLKESEYVLSLSEQGRKFDIIIIDGNHRLRCTEQAIKMLSSDGLIVLDNSDRITEKECSRLLRANGYIQVDFSGFGPVNGYCWTTSIFLKSQRIFLENFSGPSPICGLNN